MFIIPAHGVRNVHPHVSYAQDQLINNPAPIRICGAPTGSGKTYAFLQAVQKHQQTIFLVVPTQALANDIVRKAREEDILAYKWDNTQTQEALNRQKIPWAGRFEQLEEVRLRGGMIVGTLESFARLTLGVPHYQHIHLDLADIFSFQHLVFDESHTLGTRAFGLLHLWGMMIAGRNYLKEETPKLSFLSATHSNLLDELFGKDFLFPDQVAFFDEELTDQSDCRFIHGDVEVQIHPDSDLLTVVKQAGKPLLEKFGRLLLVYDTLIQNLRDKPELETFFMQHGGISKDQIVAITGQDRNEVNDHHRVILGTSAVEMGVNYDVNAAIIEPGTDAASLLQRLGRVARGGKVAGCVHLCKSFQGAVPHVEKIKHFSGRIANLREVLQDEESRSLRKINGKAAKALGSAYWSMLSRTSISTVVRHLKKFSEQLQQTGKDQHISFSGKHLNKLHELKKVAKEKDAWDTSEVEKWLQAIDKELQDVRGFSPTIRVQFKDTEVLSYSRDWLAKHCYPPDRLREDEVYEFDQDRVACLREARKSRPFNPSFHSPVGIITTPKVYNLVEAFEQYRNQLKQRIKEADLWFEDRDGALAILGFIDSTGLLVRSDQDGRVLLESAIL